MNWAAFFFAACIAAAGLCCTDSPAQTATVVTYTKFDSIAMRLNEYARRAKLCATSEGFDTSVCFLADMHRSAGDNRFVVYNLAHDSLEFAGKVAHGRCNEEWLEQPRYSNAKGSGCSSLGRYRIGGRYSGRFGAAYKLYGIDSANSNAYERNIVLHSHSCVPDVNDPALTICQSDGCVMVSAAMLKLLSAKIAATKRPVLLWLYDE